MGSKASFCSQNEFQADWGAAPEKQWNAVENETPYKSHSRTSSSYQEFDSASPQGGRVEMRTFQSLWPVGLQLQVTSLFAPPAYIFSFAVFTMT